jgi:SAM-dependent methyltransferase
VKLAPTSCAICGTRVPAEEVYPANVREEDFNRDVFSQRRLPDRIHYRMVRCLRCGLIRADPAADAQSLEHLYEGSHVFDGEEANLRRTYGRYLRRLAKHRPPGGALLEVGSGNGFFLLEARASGYADVTGVEPSREAVAKADSAIADRLVCDVMRPGLLDAATFDVVCLFQVFDHIPDPNELLTECRRILRPDGLVLALNHDVTALPNRIMRERSPIIDVEHTYLYNRATMRDIFERNGFDVLEVDRAWNEYSLGYLVRLAPLPRRVKDVLLGRARRILGRIDIRLPLGNLFLVARSPTPKGDHVG